MFDNEDFKIDKNDDAYKLHKPTLPTNVASDDEENDTNPRFKPRNINNLFAGKDDQSDNEPEEETAFEKKLNAKEQSKR